MGGAVTDGLGFIQPHPHTQTLHINEESDRFATAVGISIAQTEFYLWWRQSDRDAGHEKVLGFAPRLQPMAVFLYSMGILLI